MFRFVRVIGLVGLGLLAAGCGAGDPARGGEQANDENVGIAQFDLTSIPAGVGCVRITVTGATTVTKDFTLATPASTASLNMDRLPLGNITVDGAAYATTCGTGNTLYIADTSTASLQTGVISNLALTFRKNNPVLASANFVGNVQAISANAYANYAVIDGVIYTWGYNFLNGVTNVTPVVFSNLTNVVDLSTGNQGTTCAIKGDGTLWCWGYSNYGEAGVVAPIQVTPARAGVDAAYTMASTGGGFVCAGQPANKLVKCWGYNNDGELGNSSTISSTTPVIPVSYKGIRAVASGNAHTCIVDGLLGVNCWGFNGNGQLGDGTPTNRPYPVVVNLPSAKTIAAGSGHTCSILLDGTVRCWGFNNQGQLGDGTVTLRSTPVSVLSVSAANKLSLGGEHSCAILDDGSVKCWGSNAHAELGDGTRMSHPIAVVVPLPDPAVLLTSGQYHNCAVTKKQDIYCWGDNQDGQLGDGTFINAPKPVKVKLP